jgi:predicted nucleic acid-binding protein
MIVVDASVAVKWFSSEAGSVAALALLEGRKRLLAPALIRVEVAAAVVKKARAGVVTGEDASVMLELWFRAASSGRLVMVPDEDDLSAASRLAIELRHPIYDCLYLALAQQHAIPLVTADASFATRASGRHGEITLLA